MKLWESRISLCTKHHVVQGNKNRPGYMALNLQCDVLNHKRAMIFLALWHNVDKLVSLRRYTMHPTHFYIYIYSACERVSHTMLCALNTGKESIYQLTFTHMTQIPQRTIKFHFIHLWSYFVVNMFRHTQKNTLKRMALLADSVLALCFAELMDVFAYVVVLLQHH